MKVKLERLIATLLWARRLHKTVSSDLVDDLIAMGDVPLGRIPGFGARFFLDVALSRQAVQ